MIREISERVTKQVLAAYPGVQDSKDYNECVHDASIVVVAVKPQNLDEVCPLLYNCILHTNYRSLLYSLCLLPLPLYNQPGQ